MAPPRNPRSWSGTADTVGPSDAGCYIPSADDAYTLMDADAGLDPPKVPPPRNPNSLGGAAEEDNPSDTAFKLCSAVPCGICGCMGSDESVASSSATGASLYALSGDRPKLIQQFSLSPMDHMPDLENNKTIPLDRSDIRFKVAEIMIPNMWELLKQRKS